MTTKPASVPLTAVPDLATAAIEGAEPAELPDGVEQTLTKAQLAVYYNCSNSNVDRLIPAGLPVLDITPPGSKRKLLRFDPREVREWAKGRGR